jgi:two-component system chemotaxis sensor kinase CheA
MASETRLEQFADDLRERLDEMATRLMLAGANGVEPGDLASFATEAEKNGFIETALMARGLAASIQGKARDEEPRRQVLNEGLARLRLLVEQESVVSKKPADNLVSDSYLPPATLTNFAEDKEFITDFLAEAREHLSLIESQMLELEKDPGVTEVLHCVFRTFHTIKGLAGFLEFDMIQGVSHQVETLLDLARDGKIAVSPSIVDVVLESADYLNGELNRIEVELAGAGTTQSADSRSLIRKIELVIGTAAGIDATSSSIVHEIPQVIFGDGGAGSDSVAQEASDAPVPNATKAKEQVVTPEGAKSPDNSSVRVETAKLDQLLDMVGEMVIAQSLIRNNPALTASRDTRLLGDIAQLSRNTAEVQRITMGMRMIPIGQLFQRTARLIRDLSRKAGKQIILETFGEDTEVDKTIAEELSDPLLHMVRNSVDHGIETPGERAATGKDLVARIRLKAYHRAGQIVIEVSDDGRGLNREKILAKARANGVVEPGAQLLEAEIYNLIFEPGFSTAEKITDVSGRGVGMDVVRRNVQKLRGRIDTQSTVGQGTTFSLKLPLTLAIIDGLVVVVGANRYIVPIFAVREMFRPTPEMLSTVQGRGEMALVRGKLLPIVRLHQRLGIPSTSVDASDGFLVVTECDNKQFCLLVDDLVGKQEVVIKGLGETFKDAIGLAGCAILGDGRIGLILDMEGVYRGSAR